MKTPAFLFLLLVVFQAQGQHILYLKNQRVVKAGVIAFEKKNVLVRDSVRKDNPPNELQKSSIQKITLADGKTLEGQQLDDLMSSPAELKSIKEVITKIDEPDFHDDKIAGFQGGKANIFRNPDYVCRHFNKILIVSNARNRDKDWEDKIVADFKAQGINVIGELALLPPFKSYTEDEVKAICTKNNVDGIMTVAVKDKDINSFTTYGYGFYKSSLWGVSSTKTVQKLYIELTLFDTTMNENAFVINGNSRYGGIYDSQERILRRFTRMVADEAKLEKLVCP